MTVIQLKNLRSTIHLLIFTHPPLLCPAFKVYLISDKIVKTLVGEHVPRDMCSLSQETDINSDVCSSTQETHPLGICVSWVEEHISPGISVS